MVALELGEHVVDLLCRIRHRRVVDLPVRLTVDVLLVPPGTGRSEAQHRGHRAEPDPLRSPPHGPDYAADTPSGPTPDQSIKVIRCGSETGPGAAPCPTFAAVGSDRSARYWASACINDDAGGKSRMHPAA
jgi:hypothetical protein